MSKKETTKKGSTGWWVSVAVLEHLLQPVDILKGPIKLATKHKSTVSNTDKVCKNVEANTLQLLSMAYTLFVPSLHVHSLWSNTV